VFVPCIPGWKIDASATLDVAKKAFETNAFPLFEIENGVLTITSKPEQKKPIHEYLTIQGRFKHINPEQMELIQRGVDEHFAYLESIQGKKIFETLL
jgi:pyruvate ferredoxin oxidoreductase beta subunit